MFKDKQIRSLICFCCAQVKPDTGGCRSQIGFRSGRWLFGLKTSTLRRNFLMDLYDEHYRRPGTPLAAVGNDRAHDVACPDFSDWRIVIDRRSVEHFLKEPCRTTVASASRERTHGQVIPEELLALSGQPLICCPEDIRCSGTQHAKGSLCCDCAVPICSRCRLHLQSGQVILRTSGSV